MGRRGEWSTGLAVGSREFVARVETDLGHRARSRHVRPLGVAFILRQPRGAYGHALAVKTKLQVPRASCVLV